MYARMFNSPVPLTKNLNSTDTRRTLVLSQIKQQFTEPLLTRAASTTPSAFAGNIDQLGNTLPAGAACGGVLTVGEELFGVSVGLGAELVGLIVVRNIEIVDVFTSLLDVRFLLLVRDLGTAGNVCVSSLTPLSVVKATG